MKFKKRVKFHKKKILVILGVAIIIVAIIFSITNLSHNGNSVREQVYPRTEKIEVKTIPLSMEERSQVVDTLTSSEFIKDVPEDDPIGLRFYSYEGDQKVWQDAFLIGDNQLLTAGTPSVYLTLHSKYIPEISEGDLCQVIKTAKQRGELGFQSEFGKTKLLWKYKGMLQHRECFGF